MDFERLKNTVPTSPAFLVDEDEILNAVNALTFLRKQSGCKILYSIKSLPLVAVLERVKPSVDGFSVSSLFEARLANEILSGNGDIHLTTPGLRQDECVELLDLCSHISCNSISQFQRIAALPEGRSSLGLRINPKLSFTDDDRYDPCRLHSKLGCDINSARNSEILARIKGLHFHTVFGATDYTPLIQTLAKIQSNLGDKFAQLEWLNLGGGYLYGKIADNKDFCEMLNRLKNEFYLKIFIEPGNAVVGKAGHLLATVLDCFESDGKTIAVLDTSVNHHPEVFEYQRQPELLEHDPEGRYPALLAGSTCLAGDLFGEYRFARRLQTGDKLVFKHVGAYSLVKANRFNGYNLPDVYSISKGRIKLIKQYTYQMYRQQWASDS